MFFKLIKYSLQPNVFLFENYIITWGVVILELL